ncbi:transposase, partial [Rhodococcus opacus RKJ300 = JCM 13270]
HLDIPPGSPRTIVRGVHSKGATSLDHYQVRGYPAWYRHITLSMAAAAFLTILRRGAQKGDLKPVPEI